MALVQCIIFHPIFSSDFIDLKKGKNVSGQSFVDDFTVMIGIIKST